MVISNKLHKASHPWKETAIFFCDGKHMDRMNTVERYHLQRIIILGNT